MPKAIMLTADGFEDLEVFVPKIRLEEAGWTVDVAAPERGLVGGEHGYEVEAHFDLDEVDASDYDLLILPGGPAGGGAETVRSYRSARRVVREFFEADKTVAAICHGPWTLVSADVLKDRTLTSVHKDGVADEIEDAGATWLDEEVVVDGNLITSRTPEDLPAFMREVMKAAETPKRRRAPSRNGSRKKKNGKAAPETDANGSLESQAETGV